ncbi:MAG: hypothetical protein U5J82_08285 [Desulfobacterales bacterium]|nr:hypothetical protein [Desulfobacterales bacterium]
MAGVDLHLEQLQVLVAVHAVLARIADPLQQGLGTAVEAGGDDHPGEVVQHPRQEAVVDVAAEDVAVDLHLGVQVHHVGYLDVLDAVGKGLKLLDVLLVLGVHQGQEQRVDVLLDVVDLVDALADDVVQLDHALGVVALDVHQGVDAVVGLGIAREDVAHLVAVLKGAVDAAAGAGRW